MLNLPNTEPERSATADAYHAVGRAMLAGLAMYGAAWAPGPLVTSFAPTPPPADAESTPVVVPGRRRAPRLSLILRRLAG